MIDEWLGSSGETLIYVAVSAAAMLAWAVLVIRTVGLRSLSKMSGFDFVVTVALGSLVATTSATTASLWHGMLAFATLLGLQWTIARLRRHLRFEKLVDNQPVLLMDGSGFIEPNLTQTRVTESDVLAKLRESNVTDLDDVLAVVLETTGDVSVLQGSGPLDPRVLQGVRSGAAPAIDEAAPGQPGNAAS